ncbi:hypothetical protein MMC25_007036 [Agyrium rufum]|nr:hypothetical protein [Agyrium rufum]
MAIFQSSSRTTQDYFDVDPLFDIEPTSQQDLTSSTSLGKRRRRPSLTPEGRNGSESWLVANFPELGPTKLDFTGRLVEADLLNPLIEYGCLTHPRKGQTEGGVQAPKDGRVDGLIKFHMRAPMQTSHATTTPKQQRFPWTKHREVIMQGPEQNILRSISALPPGFGRDMKLSAMDEKLWNFCKSFRLYAILLLLSLTRA